MHHLIPILPDVWFPLTASAVLQTTAVTLCALAIVALGRKLPARLQYAILLVALVKFAVPPAMVFPTGGLQRLANMAQLSSISAATSPVTLISRSRNWLSRRSYRDRRRR